MNGLKEFLQSFALLMGVYLITNWMGAHYPWYIWLVIVFGHVAYGWVQFNRGHKCGVSHPQHVVKLSREEAEAFIKQHSENPNVKVDKRESD